MTHSPDINREVAYPKVTVEEMGYGQDSNEYLQERKLS